MPALQNKVAIITGAGSGIGAAGARLFAHEGANVVVADLNAQRAQQTADEITRAGGQAIPILCNVRDSASVQSLVAQAVQRFGQIDVLFHNAVNVWLVNNKDRCVVDLDEDVWHEITDLVLTGTFLCCKYIGREMHRRNTGSIVLTATVDALVGQAGLDAYTAAKGGVIAMTRSMAAGLAPHGIRVNAVCPGFVATEPQMAWLNDPEARRKIEALHLLPIAQPEDIAQFALYLASDQARITTGGIFPIDSGYTAFKGRSEVMEAMQDGE